MKPITTTLVTNTGLQYKLSSLNPFRYLAYAWMLVMMLSLLACSSPPQPVRPVAAASEPVQNVIAKTVKASVLITAEPQDDVIEISEVQVTPPSLVIDQHQQIELSAQAFGEGGEPIPDAELIWSMVDQRAGTVTKEGSFQAGNTPGEFPEAITVTGVQNTIHGVRYATATIAVTVIGEIAERKLASVAIIPDELTVLNRQIYRLRAVGYDDNGLIIPEVELTWEVNDPTLGHVNEIGYLTVEGQTGAYPDSVTVTGKLNGKSISATASVTVIETLRADEFLTVQILPQRFHLDPGASLQLHAVALNGLGEVVDNAIFRWDIVDSEAGSIDGSGMFFAGNTPGIFTESVKVDAIIPGGQGTLSASDFASVVVRSDEAIRKLNTIRAFPQSIKVGTKGKVLLGVEASDDQGKPAQNLNVAWQARTSDAGTIDNLGQFIAGTTPGVYQDALEVIVEQDLGNGLMVRKSETVDVTITGTLRELTIRPHLIAVAPGRTIHFSVTGRDENGVLLPGLIVKWELSDDSPGYIDHAGNFTAGQTPGTYADAITAEVIQNQPN